MRLTDIIAVNLNYNQEVFLGPSYIKNIIKRFLEYLDRKNSKYINIFKMFWNLLYRTIIHFFNVHIISFMLGYNRANNIIDESICTFQSKTLLHLTYTYILAIIGFSIFDRCCKAYNFSWLYGYETQSHMIVMIFNNAKTEYKWTRRI